MTIRAHFDGTVIVPDEPVNLPVNTPLDLDVRQHTQFAAPASDIERRREALKRFASHATSGPEIPAEALRREKMYEDRA